MQKGLAAGILIVCAMGFFPARRADAQERIVLVRAGASAPNTAERNYAATVTRRLERWLGETGVPFATIDEEGLAGAVKGAKLLILGYNPQPPPRDVALLRRFVEGGGKLLVFYSSSPELAGLMRMRLGDYQSAPLGGRWSRIRFHAAAPAHVPEWVRQESRNIRPVYPAGPEARVIATWVDAAGKTTPEPAWVLSDRGAWMSHVLLDDGDNWSKRRMLLALIALQEPSVWRSAADASIRSVAAFGGLGGFEAALGRIRAEAGRGRDVRAVVEPVLASAEAMHADLPRWLAQGRYADVIFGARRLSELVLEAWARSQPPRPGERRGVWDHTGMGLYPGNWEATCRILAASGITDIFSNVAWAGAAHYPSRVTPTSDIFTMRGDQLGQCLTAARPHGLRVHAWKVCWNLNWASADFVERMRKAGRLQVSHEGRTLKWLCPSHADNLRLEKDMIREMAGAYELDGIHLDYIRYPDSSACYCSGCRAGFEAMLKRAVARWPQDVRRAPLDQEYRQWRADRITRFVRDVRALLRKAKPAVNLSVAVYGRYPLGIASVGQDWGLWLREDLVDFVCPMDYTDDPAFFESLVKMQVALPRAEGRILPGIGVTATESVLDAFQVIDQIRTLRVAGAAGFVLFDLDGTLEYEILPALKHGLTAGHR